MPFLVSIESRKGRFAILLHHSCHLPPSFAFRLGESSIGFSSPSKSVAIDARWSLTLFAGHNASTIRQHILPAMGTHVDSKNRNSQEHEAEMISANRPSGRLTRLNSQSE